MQIEALRKAIADAWSGSSAEEEAAMALCSEVADLRNSAATSAELGSVEVSMELMARNYCMQPQTEARSALGNGSVMVRQHC